MNRCIVFFILLFSIAGLYAQPDSAISLFITCNKTTSVIFPQIIKSIDRGSRDILVQKASGVENVLQAKAAVANLMETNMTVITTDGKLYSFIVQYAAQPSHLVIRLDRSSSIFEKIATQKRTEHGVRSANGQMILRLKGLFTQNEILYYQLELENLSNISYDIEMLRFYIKDKKQSRRTASQELEQVPLTVYGNAGLVGGQSKHTIAVALQKFVIPEKIFCCIQVTEKNGEWNLRPKISNCRIIKARTLKSIY